MNDAPRRRSCRPTTQGRQNMGQAHGAYVRPPDSPEIQERVRIELEKSRTDDFADAPARFAPIVIEPKPWRD